MPKFKVGDKVVLKKGAGEMIYGGEGNHPFDLRQAWMREIQKYEETVSTVTKTHSSGAFDSNIKSENCCRLDVLEGYSINEECLDYCQRLQMLELENEL